MPFRFPFPPASGLVLAAVATAAGAQTPPIKPGLWEARSESIVDGQKAAAPGANLKRLSPAVRAQVEARMKEKGVALGNNGANRICMTQDTLDPSRWQDLGTGCKTDFQSRVGKAWKWHTSCTQPAFESDGEAVFASPEAYTVTNAMTTTVRGETRTTHMTIRAKWLGADCGDLKPFSPGR